MIDILIFCMFAAGGMMLGGFVVAIMREGALGFLEKFVSLSLIIFVFCFIGFLLMVFYFSTIRYLSLT